MVNFSTKFTGGCYLAPLLRFMSEEAETTTGHILQFVNETTASIEVKLTEEVAIVRTSVTTS